MRLMRFNKLIRWFNEARGNERDAGLRHERRRSWCRTMPSKKRSRLQIQWRPVDTPLTAQSLCSMSREKKRERHAGPYDSPGLVTESRLSMKKSVAQPESRGPLTIDGNPWNAGLLYFFCRRLARRTTITYFRIENFNSRNRQCL